jgi:hypothetical protein
MNESQYRCLQECDAVYFGSTNQRCGSTCSSHIQSRRFLFSSTLTLEEYTSTMGLEATGFSETLEGVLLLDYTVLHSRTTDI